MKVAKNGMTAFQNLLEVVRSLSSEEVVEFQRILKKKRRVETNQEGLFNETIALIEAGETVDTINEGRLKKEIEQGITPNFNKLTENLYKVLLAFLANSFKKNEWKKWQIDANDRLLEVEALLARKMYSQAMAAILKLEDRLAKKGDYTKYVYDDISLYSRLANLKIQLARFNREFFRPSELDKMLRNLLQMGWYFHKYNESSASVAQLKEQELMGYQLLARHYEEKRNVAKMVDALDEVKRKLDYIAFNNEKEDLYRSLEVLDLLKSFIELKKCFYHGQIDKLAHQFDFKGGTQYHIVSQMLLNELIYDHSIGKQISKRKVPPHGDCSYYFNLFFFTIDKIETFPERLELNRAIWYFLQEAYIEALDIVRQLKKMQAITQNKAIYYRVLMLELLCEIENQERLLDTHLRNIKATLGKNEWATPFDEKSYQLLEVLNGKTKWGKEQQLEDKVEEIEALKGLASPFEPLHQLILYTLKKNLPEQKAD